MRSFRPLGPILALTLVGAHPMRAAALPTGYDLVPVARFGEQAGGVQISRDLNAAFEVGTLNDNGELSFVTENSAGGEILAIGTQDGWSPLIAPGGAALVGRWPADLQILSPVSINQQGNLAFTINSPAINPSSAETFLWDAAASQLRPIALNGVAVDYGPTWDRGGDWVTVLNNSNEMAYVGGTQDPQFQGRSGVFYRRADGTLVSIALPDDRLEDGSEIIDASDPYLNDAGTIVFTARRKTDPPDASSAYRWLLGTRTRIAVVGTPLPGGHRVTNVLRAWVNNQNGKILLAVNTDAMGASDQIESPISLYLWDLGLFTPVAVPGQSMPDGSKLLSVQDFGVSCPNALGQYAFLARLEGGATAAYLLDEDGKLSLLLKSGTVTSLGTVSNVGEGSGTSSGIALNSAGRVALTAQIEIGPDTILLISPPAP